jgi:tetratricopeptide (TPR) repeat protein
MLKKDFTSAATFFREALDLRRKAADPKGVSYSHGVLGLCSEGLGDLETAAEHHRQAAKAAAEIGDVVAQGAALTNLGHTLFLSGRHDEAEPPLQEAIALWESMRGLLGTEYQMRVFLLDDQLVTYAVLLRTLLAQDRTEAALEVAERAKGCALADLLSRRLGAAEVAAGRSPSVARSGLDALGCRALLGKTTRCTQPQRYVDIEAP